MPSDPQNGLPAQNEQRFERANRKAEAAACGGGPRQQGGRRGARCQRPPRCFRPPIGVFAAEGSLSGEHARGLRRWAVCAWVQQQQQKHGRLCRPSDLAAARLPLGRKAGGGAGAPPDLRICPNALETADEQRTTTRRRACSKQTIEGERVRRQWREPEKEAPQGQQKISRETVRLLP